MLSKYGIDINTIVVEHGPISCFEINNTMIQYLTKFESIDVIKQSINKEVVRIIGTAMFTSKL